ncbi:retinal guanylyl cyclase 1-like [Amphiura filiformis]|uniref:retinal guanylyl cyclase 1-like n=1 Tax=Amphiura filiformis TaxID=82378 RepID=UPI003B22504E
MFYSKFVNDGYKRLLESKGDLFSSIISMENEIKLNDYENTEESWERGDIWFDQMTKYINVLFDLQLQLAADILSGLDEAIYVRQRESSISISIMVAVLLVSPMIIHAIFVQTRKIQHFSANLEMKTRELEEERERSDRLLHQMLPPTIALELKSSGTVNAEFYQEVTIFFSDVVNFTLMCAESTPMQVVDMLNRLYQSLDCLIEQFDAYKIETIGDAYMVASGIPRRNGNQHAAEIAFMSLAIRNLLHRLKIPHIPEKHYVLRIGIHTGPCAAGVVGKIMPRYCLFGDTVNTASRMESTSEAYKIHISEVTQKALEGHENFLDRFITKPRGKVAIKGKGVMSTYWLESKDPSKDIMYVKSCVIKPQNRTVLPGSVN